MKTSLSNKKIELIQWLSTIDDINLIDRLMALKIRENNERIYILSDAEKESVEAGLKDAELGKVISHSEARKKYEKWL